MSLIYNAVIAAYAGAARIVAMRSGKAALMVRGHRDSIARVQAGVQSEDSCARIRTLRTPPSVALRHQGMLLHCRECRTAGMP